MVVVVLVLVVELVMMKIMVVIDVVVLNVGGIVARYMSRSSENHFNLIPIDNKNLNTGQCTQRDTHTLKHAYT